MKRLQWQNGAHIAKHNWRQTRRIMVPAKRIELPTHALRMRCSTI